MLSAQLKVYSNRGVILKPLDFVDIVNVQKAGILYMVTMTMDSGNENFLEGCFRGTFDSGFGIVKTKLTVVETFNY